MSSYRRFRRLREAISACFSISIWIHRILLARFVNNRRFWVWRESRSNQIERDDKAQYENCEGTNFNKQEPDRKSGIIRIGGFPIHKIPKCQQSRTGCARSKSMSKVRERFQENSHRPGNGLGHTEQICRNPKYRKMRSALERRKSQSVQQCGDRLINLKNWSLLRNWRIRQCVSLDD